MLFNSLAFVIFYPIVTLLYFLLPHKFRWAHLLIASCVFYLFFIPVYIFILIFTIIIDYVAGIMIEHNYGKTRKLYLIISIIANVGVLAVFKYYNFFIENINAFLELLHITTQPIPFWKIILPIGLSFHTFQAMSYTIEVYRGNQKAEKHFGIYALYVMFYPQLVAGPIERPQNMLFQFKEKHFFNSQNLLDGFRLMLWGFFKKVVIADRLALYVNPVFDHPYKYHYLNLIIASIFFAIQIYCDFSGYSDIAIGTAKTIGFDLMTNFNRPYFSNNIQDFWKRWHISLSTWFRDYVYIPLGGNRVSVPRAYLNIAIVFILSGLWHGANWTFIVWGTLHAFFMIVTVFLKKQFGESSSFFAKTMNLLITFFIVTFAWVFFRANNITDAFLILKHIVGLYKAQPFQFILLNYAGGIEFTASGIAISIITILLLFAVEMKLPSNMTTLNSKPVADIFFCSVVIGMFQKEVAQRAASKEGSKVYGVLSVLVQAYYDVEYLFDVSNDCFNPPPKVQSGVIRLKRRTTELTVKSERYFWILVKTAFNQRRKTLRNALKSQFTPEELQDKLFDRRAETLSVDEFAALTFRMI